MLSSLNFLFGQRAGFMLSELMPEIALERKKELGRTEQDSFARIELEKVRAWLQSWGSLLEEIFSPSSPARDGNCG